jgi:hypothetical protein
MRAALFFLTAVVALRPKPCGPEPNCGGFYAFISRTNCSLNKMLLNGYVEFSENTTACADAKVAGAPTDGRPVTCMDGGYGTGNHSYYYFTSGSGQYIHQFFMSKTVGPTHALVATLPKSYDFILGMQRVPWAVGNLYVFTTTTIYQVPEVKGAPAPVPVLDIRNLSLSHNSLITTNRTLGRVFILDSDQRVLHIIALPSGPIKSLPLKYSGSSVGPVTFMQLMGSDDDPLGLIGMTASSPIELVRIDATNGSIANLYDMPSNTSVIAPISAVEMGSILHFADKETMYTMYVEDSPFDFGLPTPFDASQVLGNTHFFL